MTLAAWSAIAVAPAIGSFLGVLIRRLPHGAAVAWSRSHCESCGAVLGAAELVPLASYAWLRGRCRRCGSRIAPFYPAVELAALLVAVWAGTVDQESEPLWLSCALGWTLLALAWIDAETLTLPDALTLPLSLGGLAAVAWRDPASLAEHIVAASGAWLTFLVLARGYQRLRGRAGLGDGDAKLLAAAAAWVGLAPLGELLLLAALSGLAWTLARRRPLRQDPLAFGPHLALATWLIWLYG